MGSYGDDEWLNRSWCATPEEVSYHTDIDGIGVLCLRCQYYGPPHFEYLRDLLGPCFLSGTTAKTMTVAHIIIKIAAFAYEPCTITEVKALHNGLSERYANECDFCNNSWEGWICQYCLKKHQQ